MFHGFDYADETGENILATRFWNAKMSDGVIQFPAPWDISDEMKQPVRPVRAKQFSKEFGNFSGLEEDSIQQELAEMEGEP